MTVLTASPASAGAPDAVPETGEVSAGPATRVGRLRAWDRDFTLLWGGSATAHLGAIGTATANPLLALALTGSPVFAGWVTAASTIPRWLMHLPAGVLVDRFNRRSVMVTSQVVRLAAILLLICGFAVLDKPAGLLLVVAAVEGTFTAFYNVAEIAAVRRVAPQSKRPEAMAKNEARNHVAQLLGRPLGGFLFSLGHVFPYVAGLVTTLASTVPLFFVDRSRFQPVPGGDKADTTTQGGGFGAGLRWLAKDAFLCKAIATCTVMNLLLQAVLMLAVVMAERALSSSLVGLLLATSGVAGLLGAVVAPRVLSAVSPDFVVTWSTIAWMPLIMVVAIFDQPVVGLIAWGCYSFMGAHVNVALATHQGDQVPDALQGRVASIIRLVTYGAVPIGALSAGYLVKELGPQKTAWLVAIAMAITASVVSQPLLGRVRRQSGSLVPAAGYGGVGCVLPVGGGVPVARGQILDPDGPRVIGPYELISRLGSGGQGTVYLGRAPDDNEVAIKLLHHRLVHDPHAEQRFVHEVEVARRVLDFTARVLDAGVDESTAAPYIVSEYIDGPSLESHVAAHGTYEPGALRRLASGSVTALAAIHGAGIVHCDFKPANILLGPDGPRVIDFGIARALSTISPQAGSQIGTPAYMAPEQITQGTVGPHTDLFAWASTMVYAATGTPAFGHDDGMHGVMYRIVHKEPDLAGVPDTMVDVLAACLAKRPGNRPDATQVMLSLVGPEISAPLMPYGVQIGIPSTGHTGAIACIAYGRRHGRPIAITGSHDQTARVWDLTDQRQVGDPLRHGSPVLAVAYGRNWDDQPVAITGGHDHSLMVWDLVDGRRIGEPLTGHRGSVVSIAYGQCDGEPVAISVSDDRSVRVWELAGQCPAGPPLTTNNTVMSVAYTVVDERPVAVIGGAYDQTIRMWDLETRQQVGTPLSGHISTVMSVACGQLEQRPIVVTGSYDQTVRIWDLSTGQECRAPLRHDSAVMSVAYGWLGPQPIVLSSCADRTVRVWNLATSEEIGPPLRVGPNTGSPLVVAYGQLEGRPVAITGGGDLAVRIWSLGSYTGR